MGRAARARATGPTPAAAAPAPVFRLKPEDYWELRSRIRDVEAVELDLMKERAAGLARLEAAKQTCRALLARLTTAYALPDTTFTWNDDRHELIPEPVATKES